jgi:thioredoxin
MATMTNAAIELTDATFDEFVGSAAVPVLIDFWAPWCGPCHTLRSIIEDIAGELSGHVVLVAVDTDANPGIGFRYSVQSVPTLVLISDGVVTHRSVGAKPRQRLRDEIAAALSS